MSTTLHYVNLTDPQAPDWEALRKQLWRKLARDRFGHQHSAITHDARLSEEAWEAIKKLIETKKIPVTMCNVSFGFSVGITLWAEKFEPFPGAVEEPRPLITIAAGHLPSYESGGSFELGWDTFSPLTHSDENRTLLEWNKLPQPGSKVSYDY